MMQKKRPFRPLYDFMHTRFFQVCIGLIIAFDLISTIGVSFVEFHGWNSMSLATSLLAALIFTIEYLCRFLVAPHQFPHVSRWKARLKYLCSFFGIVDFIAILPFAGIFVLGGFYKDMFEVSQVFLIFKLIRYSRSFHYISEVFKTVKDDLATVFGSMLIFMLFSALLMYHVEHNAQPEAFANVGEGLWWSVVTFTSIGYGDIYPVTFWGKLLGGIVAFLGVMMVAIPTGIISSAFVNYKLKRQLPPRQTAPQETPTPTRRRVPRHRPQRNNSEGDTPRGNAPKGNAPQGNAASKGNRSEKQ